MMGWVLRFLVLLPVIEVVLIVLVWHAVGPWWTLGLLFSGSFAGLALLRLSPAHALTQARSAMASGRVPDTALFEGMRIGAAGLLLLVPGFFSDFLGLALLAGLGRRWLTRHGKNGPPGPGGHKPLEGRFRIHGD